MEIAVLDVIVGLTVKSCISICTVPDSATYSPRGVPPVALGVLGPKQRSERSMAGVRVESNGRDMTYRAADDLLQVDQEK